MTTVERVKMILKEQGIPVSKMEKDLGFANGYIGQLKKGTIRDDRLNAIADYLGVSTNFLSTGNSALATDIFREKGKVAIQIERDPEFEKYLKVLNELQEMLDDPNGRFLMNGYGKIKYDPEKVRIMRSFMKSLSGDDDLDAY